MTFHEVEAEYAGQRLDNFLIRLLKGVPKSRIYRLLRKGEVRVNKGRVKADTRLAAGDVIRVAPIRVSDSSSQGMPGRQMRTRLNESIIFEDDGLIVLINPVVWRCMAEVGFPLGLLNVFVPIVLMLNF